MNYIRQFDHNKCVRGTRLIREQNPLYVDSVIEIFDNIYDDNFIKEQSPRYTLPENSVIKFLDTVKGKNNRKYVELSVDGAIYFMHIHNSIHLNCSIEEKDMITWRQKTMYPKEVQDSKPQGTIKFNLNDLLPLVKHCFTAIGVYGTPSFFGQESNTMKVDFLSSEMRIERCCFTAYNYVTGVKNNIVESEIKYGFVGHESVDRYINPQDLVRLRKAGRIIDVS